MQQLDWSGLLFSALWVLGLAELLATASWVYWLGSVENSSWRLVLARPLVRLLLAAGFVLFALGMLLSVEAAWEKAGWGVVVVLMVWEGIGAWRQGR